MTDYYGRMKPESMFRVRQLTAEIKQLEAERKHEEEQDPGSPPGWEGLLPIEAYDQIAVRLIPMLDPELTHRDERGLIKSGTTPGVLVNNPAGIGPPDLLLYFKLEELISPGGSSITAILTDPEHGNTPKPGAFRYEEWVRRADMGSDLNGLMRSKLHNLEWSLVTFDNIACQQTPEQAEEAGFPKGFIESLPKPS